MHSDLGLTFTAVRTKPEALIAHPAATLCWRGAKLTAMEGALRDVRARSLIEARPKQPPLGKDSKRCKGCSGCSLANCAILADESGVNGGRNVPYQHNCQECQLVTPVLKDCAGHRPYATPRKELAQAATPKICGDATGSQSAWTSERSGPLQVTGYCEVESNNQLWKSLSSCG